MCAWKFYLLDDDNPKDDGRYLTLTNAAGRKTFQLCGFDWQHFSRTSLYFTEDKNLAVLEPEYCDYVFDLRTLSLSSARGVSAEKWTYLGAFQIVVDGPHFERKLRFIEASEQAECIESGNSPLHATARTTARRGLCEAPRR